MRPFFCKRNQSDEYSRRLNSRPRDSTWIFFWFHTNIDGSRSWALFFFYFGRYFTSVLVCTVSGSPSVRSCSPSSWYTTNTPNPSQRTLKCQNPSPSNGLTGRPSSRALWEERKWQHIGGIPKEIIPSNTTLVHPWYPYRALVFLFPGYGDHSENNANIAQLLIQDGFGAFGIDPIGTQPVSFTF